MTSGSFLIRCYRLRGVNSREGVAVGHHAIFDLRAAGRDHFHICAGLLSAVIVLLLLETSVQQALRGGGGHTGLTGHAFHLQLVQDNVLGYMGQRAGGVMYNRKWTAAFFLASLEIFNGIQTLSNHEKSNKKT